MALISNVRLWTRDHETVKASGTLTVADAFDVKFTLIQAKDGLFVSLPRRQYDDAKSGQKKWSYEVFCTSNDARTEMLETVLAAYDSFQFKHNIKPDYCNTGGIEMFEKDCDGEGNPGWSSWCDEETGVDDPEEWLEQQKEKK